MNTRNNNVTEDGCLYSFRTSKLKAIQNQARFAVSKVSFLYKKYRKKEDF